MSLLQGCGLPHEEVAPVRDFLVSALGRKLRGDASQYDVVVEQLGTRNDEDMLFKILVGLCSCVSQLTTNPEAFRSLITSLLNYNFSSAPRISAAYLNLLGCLVSSNATFLIPCLDFLVKSFTLESSAKANASSSSSSSSAPSSSSSAAAVVGSPAGVDDNRSISSMLGGVTETDQRSDQIHFTLAAIIRLAPTGLSELFPMLAKRFPHKRFSIERLCAYVQHLLRVCEYLPVLQPKILDLILLRCLEMDVEIVIEDSGEVKIQEDAFAERSGADEMFLLDEDPDGGGGGGGGGGVGGGGGAGGKYINSSARAQGGGGSASASAASVGAVATENDQRIPPEVAELADKLDALLALLLQFVDKSRGAGEAEERLFHQLLNVFEERVLVTHRSKFVQFVLFYFAGRSERFACALAGRLLRCFEDPASSPLKQQSAVLYLGSLLARATFLPQAVVSDTVSALLQWCSNYVGSAYGDSALSATVAATIASLPASSLDGGRSYIGALLSKPLSSSSGSTGSTTSSASGVSDNAPGSPHAHADQQQQQQQQQQQPPPPPSPPALPWSPPQRRRADVTVHETFYYAMQAVLYIYCFHGTELAAVHQHAAARLLQHQQHQSSAGRGRATLLHLERCVASSLEPLRFCLATVRTEFLRLALHAGLLSAACVGSISADLMPGAGEAAAAAAAAVGAAAGRPVPIKMLLGPSRRPAPRSLTAGSNPLDTFFPFDPCLLRRLHQPVEPWYRHWTGVPGLDDDPGADQDQDQDQDDFDGMDQDGDADGDEGGSETSSASSSVADGTSQQGAGMEHYQSSQSTSLASSSQPFGTYSSGQSLLGGSFIGSSAMEGVEADHAVAAHPSALTASNVLLASQGGGMPFRRPRQYSVGSTGSF